MLLKMISTELVFSIHVKQVAVNGGSGLAIIPARLIQYACPFVMEFLLQFWLHFAKFVMPVTVSVLKANVSRRLVLTTLLSPFLAVSPSSPQTS